jgi:cytoskeletal protein RodZ
MGLFDRFRNIRRQSVMPQEVEEYYQSEQRQRRGVAIGLAVVALLAAMLVIAGLFFGGRYVYNKFIKDDNKPAAVQQEDKNEDKKSGDEQVQAPGSNSTDEPAPSTPAPTPAPDSSTANPQPQTTPNLGDEPLPRTGDEGM